MKKLFIIVPAILLIFGSTVLAETLHFIGIHYCAMTCDPSVEKGPKGIIIDILEEIMTPEGIEINVTFVPFKRISHEIKKEKYDGVLGGNNTHFPDLIQTKKSIVTNSVGFYVRHDTQWRYNGIASLKKIRIGRTLGFKTMNKEIDNYLEGSSTPCVQHLSGKRTEERNLIKLMKSRIDVFVGGSMTTAYIIKKMELTNKIIRVSDPISLFHNHILFHPRNSKAEYYIRLIDMKLPELEKSGKLKNILKRYGHDSF